MCRYVPLKLGDWFKSSGIAADNVHEMNWWDEVVHAGTNIRVAYTPAQVMTRSSPAPFLGIIVAL